MEYIKTYIFIFLIVMAGYVVCLLVENLCGVEYLMTIPYMVSVGVSSLMFLIISR